METFCLYHVISLPDMKGISLKQHGGIFIFNGIWAFAMVFLLGSCREGGFRLDPAFVDLYVDLKLASIAPTKDLGKSGEVRRVILSQHEISSADFHERFVSLAGHPEAWKPFQEAVIRRIDALQRQHGEKGE